MNFRTKNIINVIRLLQTFNLTFKACSNIFKTLIHELHESKRQLTFTTMHLDLPVIMLI